MMRMLAPQIHFFLQQLSSISALSRFCLTVRYNVRRSSITSKTLSTGVCLFVNRDTTSRERSISFSCTVRSLSVCSKSGSRHIQPTTRVWQNHSCSILMAYRRRLTTRQESETTVQRKQQSLSKCQIQTYR